MSGNPLIPVVPIGWEVNDDLGLYMNVAYLEVDAALHTVHVGGEMIPLDTSSSAATRRSLLEAVEKVLRILDEAGIRHMSHPRLAMEGAVHPADPRRFDEIRCTADFALRIPEGKWRL